MEVWKLWMQMWGLLPTDEMQRLRAENELLKVQLEIARSREHMLRNMPSFGPMGPEPLKPWVDKIWASTTETKK